MATVFRAFDLDTGNSGSGTRAARTMIHPGRNIKHPGRLQSVIAPIEKDMTVLR